jgi:hypothetical protein
MSDEAAKRVLWVAILVGAAIGLAWGSSRWGAMSIMTWNLMGFGVIVCVGLAALVIGVRTFCQERKRLRASEPPAAPTN